MKQALHEGVKKPRVLGVKQLGINHGIMKHSPAVKKPPHFGIKRYGINHEITTTHKPAGK